VDEIKNSEILEAAGTIKEVSYGKFYSSNYELNGNPKGYNLEILVKNPQENIEKIILLAKYYYHKNGMIMRVVNIIRDFGSDNLNLEYPTKDRKTKRIIENFNKRININEVTKDIIFEVALTGNCAGYNRDGKRIDIYPISRIKVSPLIINNKPVVCYKADELLYDFNYTSYTDIPDEIIEQIKLAYPSEIADGFENNKNIVVLDTKNSFFCKVNSSRYEPYGVTFLLPAFDELAHKNVLKEAETSTANAIIEKILRISVGDKDNKPNDTAVEFYDNLINGKKGSIKATVPYYVDMKWIEPDSSIFGENKFIQVDKDLLSALGVSLTLIRGEGGGNYSDGIINVAGLIKTIENIRNSIISVIEDWYAQELIRNGINVSHCPKVSFPKINIDDNSRIELVQWLFEHAGLPYSVLYNESGYDYTSVKLLREEENEENVEDIFELRDQPFQGPAKSEGQPEKSLSKRKTDKSKSNNDQPRPSD